MIASILAALLAVPASSPPSALTVLTPRGETHIDIRRNAVGGLVLPAEELVAALDGRLVRRPQWADVIVARQTFSFLLDAPLYRFNDRLEPLVAPATVERDTLFIPLQFAAEVLPRFLSERYHYEETTGSLIERGARAGRPAAPPPEVARLPNGLLPGHVVTIDPGHGGRHPGNPGRFFPAGIQEKHVTLEVGLLLRDELTRRGITVRMTRTTDVFVGLRERAAMCGRDCDLFVSLHVDALDPRRRPDYRSISGFSSYIIGNENTEDTDRVAQMENEALLYEPDVEGSGQGPLDFILRDLQMNEYLRESERAGALIQDHIDRVHPGGNRGVHQSNRLAVLNLGRRPAVLVEMGYATNRGDARFLTTASRQRSLAAAIADAIVAYLLEFERKTTTDHMSGLSP